MEVFLRAAGEAEPFPPAGRFTVDSLEKKVYALAAEIERAGRYELTVSFPNGDRAEGGDRNLFLYDCRIAYRDD